MAVGGDGAVAGGAGCGVRVFAGGASLDAVGGVGAAAVVAFAAAAGVAADGAVPILPARSVRLGEPEVDRFGDED